MPIKPMNKMKNDQVEEFVKVSSTMAGDLANVFEECGKLKSSEILVPQDVKHRLEEICEDCEKIVKDMPNKKFSVTVHVHAGKKAQSYLDTINEKVKEFSSNRTSFVYLSNFFGSIPEYNKEMLKYNDKFESIVADVKKLVEKNPKLLENKKFIYNEVLEPCKKDKSLVGLGCIGRKKLNSINEKRLDYKRYIKSYFQEFIDYKIDNKRLPEVYMNISGSLARVKEVVKENEEKRAKGIGIIRNAITAKLSGIISTFNNCKEIAEEQIIFLQGLPIEDPIMAKDRRENITTLKNLLGKYEKDLVKMNDIKSSVIYGETIVKDEGFGQKSR